ncbi:WXG100 family type VII secretion target [Nocardia nova]|uniref:WXG100 family type VII secretion target n=1 Tax=Nocardia nova TaxID=37330 RepID=A0A2S6ALD1_9NOCA|nr:WXG100 family type VII secretion target [Nocardia nova]PPJ31764.1 WXG100 family type VII secretion target [Nocardia nova]PPJ36003.1 WXG100 family type VII secretion target [Nocardia nova]
MTTPTPGDGYRVDLDHLDAVTAAIAGLQGFVADSLAGLDARVAAAHQSWTGSGADKHRAAHQEWMKAAEEVHDGIEKMRAAAAAAHGHYSNAVAANLKLLGR